jgi:hypothetical protein
MMPTSLMIKTLAYHQSILAKIYFCRATINQERDDIKKGMER